MRIIASFGLKGGVGKTTSVINYAAALSFIGYKVLIIDIDHNSSVNNVLSSQEDVIKTHLFITDLLLDRDIPPLPFIREHKGNSVIRNFPKTPINIDFIASSRTESEVFDQKLALNRLEFKKELLFPELLNRIQQEKNYDFILFDVSPVGNTLTCLSLMVCDGVIINSLLGIHETKYILDQSLICIEQFSNIINKEIKILGIQFNACRTYVPDDSNKLKSAKYLYKEPVLLPIPRSSIINKLNEKTVFEMPLSSELIEIYLSNTKTILSNLNNGEK